MTTGFGPASLRCFAVSCITITCISGLRTFLRFGLARRDDDDDDDGTQVPLSQWLLSLPHLSHSRLCRTHLVSLSFPCLVVRYQLDFALSHLQAPNFSTDWTSKAIDDTSFDEEGAAPRWDSISTYLCTSPFLETTCIPTCARLQHP